MVADKSTDSPSVNFTLSAILPWKEETEKSETNAENQTSGRH